jgi:hypothetical protein
VIIKANAGATVWVGTTQRLAKDRSFRPTSVKTVDVSMYSRLLVSALDLDEPSDGESTTDAALIQLRRCRDHLDGRPRTQGGEESYGVLIQHLAYDVALIRLARLSGVECDAEEFDLPEKARTRFEAVLAGRGFPLDEIEGQVGLGVTPLPGAEHPLTS